MKKYSNFASALRAFEQAGTQDLENEFVQSGIINKFSLQFELSWKLMKELLVYEGDGTAATGSPREIIKASWRYFDFMDEATWLGMLRDRNDSTHIYDADLANQLVHDIIDRYIPAFQAFESGIVERYGELLEE